MTPTDVMQLMSAKGWIRARVANLRSSLASTPQPTCQSCTHFRNAFCVHPLVAMSVSPAMGCRYHTGVKKEVPDESIPADH